MAFYPTYKNDPNRARLSACKYHKAHGHFMTPTQERNMRRYGQPSRPKHKRTCTQSNDEIVRKWKRFAIIATALFIAIMCMIY